MRFLEGAKRRGVSAVTRTGEAIDATDAQTFVSFAKRFDLSVLPQAGSNDAGREEIFIEAASSAITKNGELLKGE